MDPAATWPFHRSVESVRATLISGRRIFRQKKVCSATEFATNFEGTAMKPEFRFLVFALLSFQSFHRSPAAETIQYERLKGDTLKEVLKPIPPKEPAEALRSLEIIDGFSVEFVAHEPLVLDPVAAA